jgi:HEAT repeat protein
MADKKSPSDGPQLDADDNLILEMADSKPEPEDEPDSARSRVRAAISQMSASGDDAEARYQATLNELKSDPKAAVAAMYEIYKLTSEDQYVDRWSQIHLLSELRESAALPVFNAILSTPIPPEKMPGMVTHSTVGEEVMIRTTAIEGIVGLARQGDQEAAAMLRKHVQHDSFSVRRAAIQGYLEVGGAGAREELSKLLPEKDHFILDIRRANVGDVPQPRVEAISEERDQAPPARIPSLAKPTIDD